tara:strand:+ start:6006 stop:7343 length:1338 start_codon:yes stop_codon:yes gene_type:complete
VSNGLQSPTRKPRDLRLDLLLNRIGAEPSLHSQTIQLDAKESFVAAATAIPKLRRLPALDIWSENDGLFAFLFGRADEHLLVAWREDPQIPDAIWAVRTDAQKLIQTDLFGNSTELPLIDGVALVTLSAPHYYDFVGSKSAPEQLGPLVRLPQTVSPDADGIASLELKLQNPLQRTVTVTATAQVKASANSPQTITRNIATGETGIFPLRFNVGQGALGEIVTVDAALSFKELAWAPSLQIPVVYNSIRTDTSTRIELNSLNQVLNKQDYDPHTLHLLWGSPADLSVRAKIHSSPASRLVKVTCQVTDNQHYAATAEEALLDGDALEIGWENQQGLRGHVAIAGDLGASPRNEFYLGTERMDSPLISAIQITREGKTTTWELTLDTRQMGLNESDFEQGIRFNFAVHDNDGEGPKSWMSPTPGLGGRSYFSSEHFYRLELGSAQD